MEKGISNMVKYIMRFMPKTTKINVDDFIASIDLSRIEPPAFTEQIKEFEKNTKLSNLEILKEYTSPGPESALINGVLRNVFVYEVTGQVTEEKRIKYREKAEEISELIHTFPKTNSPFFTYRGTDIKEFSKYGIYTIDELETLKGKYLYEEGFTSTSLSRDKSRFNKETLTGIKNIEVRYLIPQNSNDGIPLLGNNYSWYPEEEEYLLDCSSLSKVIDVKRENNKGYLTVALIPKQIWNVVEDNYSNTNNEESAKTI